MERRNFLKIIGAGAAVVAVQPSLIKGTLRADDGKLYRAYERVQLVGKDAKPIVLSDLKKEVNYIFNYPHKGTPSVMVNLSTPAKEVELTSEDGEKYVVKGGIGKNSNIVAYSAICPHQLTHPNPADSFFAYVPTSKKTMAYEKGGVIVCSSHLSAFDPASGGKRVAGPAAQGLPQIVLETAEDGTIWAVGVLGPEKFYPYFKAFKREFKKYYGGKRGAKKLVSVSAPTVLLEEYTKDIVLY